MPKLLGFDRIDRRLLKLLQEDADASAAALAERVHLSPTAVARRIERLRREGVIRRFVALLDPAKMELTTLVYVGVVLDRSTPESFGAFEAAARKLHGCLECHLVAGEFDYFLVLRTKDIEQYNRLHGQALIRLPGVRQIRSFFVLNEILSTTALPVEEKKPLSREAGEGLGRGSRR